MDIKKLNRREFIKSGAFAVALVPAIGALMSACTKKEDGATTSAAPSINGGPLPESDPVAMALGYVSDGAKADKVRFPKKATAEGAKQNCSNCIQYTSINASSGKCAIFPKNTVSSNGWCNSWMAKAATKKA
ncbi:MAG: high-potential iron-sulfur protein [Xanthomonadaceae bacterium]|nr:high-potential iron-sulfur protein [Xanthomonadaceae bacterium]